MLCYVMGEKNVMIQLIVFVRKYNNIIPWKQMSHRFLIGKLRRQNLADCFEKQTREQNVLRINDFRI